MTPPSKSQAKAEAKRAFLIEQATICLAEKGYAHVSLRDIAKESGVSLGILHYYFASKEELLLEVIASYKERFIAELEREVVAAPLDNFFPALAAVLGRSLLEDRKLHRLWYDLQAQALYTPVFLEQVHHTRNRLHDLIARMLKRLQTERGAALAVDVSAASSILYSVIDGMILQSLLDESRTAAEAISRFQLALHHVLESLFSSGSPATHPVERGD
ncbi:TetR/AcrR family transcriptional regulator [Brevibacillus sp. NSP2.1]|uniref:TetR/AcrR family transcriptional regulator n=1 Tax=Brevibacillus TaxID=55080 RepID=UPI000409E0C4|nr:MULTISPECIES: TetR/AcrR family transcriptional regulator [Brevibacillus]QHZ55153.1 TetR/AcrR family transcriptional regulator [Brevibacillus sp. NSP2.1]